MNDTFSLLLALSVISDAALSKTFDWIEGKVDIEQGILNYGKLLAVGIDGNVKAVPVNMVGGGLTWGTLAGENGE